MAYSFCFGIYATIIIGQEIQCLPYAGFDNLLMIDYWLIDYWWLTIDYWLMDDWFMFELWYFGAKQILKSTASQPCIVVKKRKKSLI